MHSFNWVPQFLVDALPPFSLFIVTTPMCALITLTQCSVASYIFVPLTIIVFFNATVRLLVL